MSMEDTNLCYNDIERESNKAAPKLGDGPATNPKKKHNACNGGVIKFISRLPTLSLFRTQYPNVNRIIRNL